MLATEIESRCFQEKRGWRGWTKVPKRSQMAGCQAVSSDLEKARRLAKKNSQDFWEKAAAAQVRQRSFNEPFNILYLA